MRVVYVAITVALLGGGVARAADSSSPFSPSHRKLGQGTELIVAGKYREAEPVLREALAIDPMLAEAHYNLGVSLREQGRNREAIPEYRAALDGYALDDEPNRSKALYGAALAAEDSGDPE